MRTKIVVALLGMTIGVIVPGARPASLTGQEEEIVKIEKRMCPAPDGVKIVYSAAGKGEPALVFIHGGLANRGFWEGQLKAFADRYRVIAIDLPGHGESGINRKKWGMT